MSSTDDFTQINDIKEFSKRVDKVLAAAGNRETQGLSKYFDSIGEYISNRNITPEHRGYALLLVKEASECSRNKKDGRFIQAISQAPRLLQAVYAIAIFENEREFPDRGSCYFKDKFQERYVLEEERKREGLGNLFIGLAMEMIFYWKTFYRFQEGVNQQEKSNFEILYENFKSLGEKAKKHLDPYEKDQNVLEFFVAERQELKVLKNEKYPLQIAKEIYGTHLCMIYHQDLRNKLDVAENKIRSLEFDIKELKLEKGNLEQSLKKAEEKIRNLEAENKKLQTEKGNLEQNLKKAEEKIRNLEAENKKLMGEKSELSIAFEESKKANKSLTSKNENLDKSLEERVTENFELKNSVKVLGKKLDQLTQDNTNTKEELNLKNKENESLLKEKTQHKSIIQTLQTSIQTLQSKINDKVQEIQNLQAINNQINQEKETSKERNIELTSENADLKSKIQRLTTENSSLNHTSKKIEEQKDELSTKNNEIAQIQEKMELIKSELANENSRLKDKIKSLEGELAGLKTRPNSFESGGDLETTSLIRSALTKNNLNEIKFQTLNDTRDIEQGQKLKAFELKPQIGLNKSESKKQESLGANKHNGDNDPVDNSEVSTFPMKITHPTQNDQQDKKNDLGKLKEKIRKRNFQERNSGDHLKQHHACYVPDNKDEGDQITKFTRN